MGAHILVVCYSLIQSNQYYYTSHRRDLIHTGNTHIAKYIHAHIVCHRSWSDECEKETESGDTIRKRNNDIIETGEQEGRISWSSFTVARIYIQLIFNAFEGDETILIVMSAENFMFCLYVITKTDKSLGTVCIVVFFTDLVLSHSNHKYSK